MRLLAAVLLLAVIVLAVVAAVQWLRNAVLDRRLRRANDPLQYLTRQERREHARALAKRHLSEADEAYYQRLNDMLQIKPVL
ncbi:hypothetical protein CROSSROADS_50 [Mycobacterium phage Crossroads]|uniref:hypothetical protein n=1 Tax=Mycobacterium phage Crossroads TaxID=1340836 RepID=UPI00038809BC|nr:hypothetical protein N848_gp050 [Mycobacterium phage Crossroads]AGT13049.1 hypothetical protein CROSSROADS_50 [Mycobacterium phage Crossroads]